MYTGASKLTTNKNATEATDAQNPPTLLHALQDRVEHHQGDAANHGQHRDPDQRVLEPGAKVWFERSYWCSRK